MAQEELPSAGDYEWDVDQIVAEMDDSAMVRDQIRDSSKLIADVSKNPKLPVKPGMKILAKHNMQITPLARRMKNVKDQKATPIDTCIDVVVKILGKHGIKLDAEAVHTQSWDLKNLLTFLRSCWVRQIERPIKDISLVVDVSQA